MKTFNTHYSTLEALQSFILENLIEDSSSLLIQVFTAHNNKSYIESLLKDINYIFSKAVLIGSTTDGEICNGEVSTMSTVISFTQFEKTQLDVYSDSGNDCYFDAGKKLASTIIKPDSKAVIAFIDGLNGNGEEFLKGISSINSTVVIAGGMAGDNAQFEVSYVFTKTDIMDNGVVGVSLSSEYLHAMSDYSFHWLRVGKELSITKAEKNRVYQINNLSAYDTYAHYLGTNIAEKLPAVGIEFPLIINRDGVDIARAVIGKEDDGSLIFAGNLHEGDRVNFGYGDSDSILSHAHKHCAHIQKYPVESLFIYSCMARRRFMPHDIDKEIKPLNSIAPTSGFFTYGEFFSASHNELLNQTMTILALSESDNIHTKIALDTIQEEHSETMQALAHLINISSSELISQNERQTRIYKRLHYIGQQVNEQLEIDELYNIAVNFANNELNFEKCLIFEHDDYNGWFKVKKSIGYESPIEKQILKIINLLLSGEVIEYLRVSGKPIIHTMHNFDDKVASLAKSLFLQECYFELIGGDVEIPHALIIVGNGFDTNNFSHILEDSITMLALGNFTTQISNAINNIVFYKAWNNERKSLEENILKRTKQINEQKKTFEAIYKTSKDGIAILDLSTTAFLDFNQAYADMTGYTPDELLRLSYLKLSIEEDQSRSTTALQEVVEKGFIKNFEKRCIHKDGSIFSVSMSIALMENKEHILVSSRDISSQKELEVRLRDAKQKAEENTKVKSEFLANMSHEIRTPMNGILGMSHLALQSNLNTKQKHYIQNIDASAKSLLGIINDILDFSKIEAGKLDIEKTDFDMFQVIDNVIHVVEFKAYEKNLELIVNYDASIGKIFYGDSLRLGQILTNLLSNAVKFTQEGEIGIYIKKVAQDTFRFEVKDTGIGLSENEQSKLFKSFSQADGSTTRKYGGTGLGLSISKQLVELMDGKIWLESKKGVGSNFIFEIKLIEQESRKTFRLFSDKKVLIVDNNESWHEVLANALAKFDISVEHAYNAREALDKVYHYKGAFDLILMDWNIPELDGIETTRMIQNIYKKSSFTNELPPSIIMASSFRQELITKLAKDVGIDIFLQKPVNPSLLNDILNSVFLDNIDINQFVEDEKNTLKETLHTLAQSRILLVEDNSTNQEIVIGLLEDSGIHIDIASNGEEGVRLFKQREYELIFMDLQMPIMDGYEATKHIRALDKEIPIIALTANAMQEDIQKTQEAEMNEHLNKPIDIEKLYATLLKYISKKQEIPHLHVKELQEEITIPKFKNIDTKLGLRHLVGNKKLYLKILRDFYNNYHDFLIDDYDEESFKRATHTLKGLSLNIGATNLHVIAKELDETQDKSLLTQFYNELHVIINELEVLQEKKKTSAKYLLLQSQKRALLFAQLEDAISTKQPKKCQPVIQEIEQYILSVDDEIFFNKVKKLIRKYQFKDAQKLFHTK